ncbi:MAG: hypothetical protein ACRDI3_05410 [Actinomycetota bacterium]
MASTAKKLIGLICVLGLIGALAASPAIAGKKKKGSFSAENPLPYPGQETGCDEGPEDLSRTTEEVKVPFNGVLTVTMENFMGDWDLFVKDDDDNLLSSGTGSQLQGEAAEEEVTVTVKKGMKLQIIPCNWLGGPSAEVTWQIASF